MKQIDDTELDNDFGFSFIGSNSDEKQDLEQRLDNMYRMIDHFLKNLTANPESDTIFWPNRVEKIKQYREKLKKLAKGE